jgi:hypothetical protein
MCPLRSAAAALLVLFSAAQARACDSYADDMSLASVLAGAVSAARANGSLQAQEVRADASAPNAPAEAVAEAPPATLQPAQYAAASSSP